LTTDQLTDVARLRNGSNIRRQKDKSNMPNDKRIKSCVSRFNKRRLQSPVVSVCGQAFCRRSHGEPTAA